MCECIENHWRRYFEETQNGRFPFDRHHPDCSEFQTKEYKVIHFDGSRCIVPVDELKEHIDNLESQNEYDYKIETVHITEYQFNRIPEFVGW